MLSILNSVSELEYNILKNSRPNETFSPVWKYVFILLFWGAAWLFQVSLQESVKPDFQTLHKPVLLSSFAFKEVSQEWRRI